MPNISDDLFLSILFGLYRCQRHADSTEVNINIKYMKWLNI